MMVNKEIDPANLKGETEQILAAMSDLGLQDADCVAFSQMLRDFYIEHDTLKAMDFSRARAGTFKFDYRRVKHLKGLLADLEVIKERAV